MSNVQTNRRYYVGRAASWVLGLSSTGKEQVGVKFNILTEGASHAELTWYGYFTDAAFDKTLDALRTMGWSGDDLSDLTGLDTNEVSLVVADEVYDGKTSARILWVNKLSSGPAVRSVLEGGAAKSFAAAMKDRVRAHRAATGAATKPAGSGLAERQGPGPSISKDDLPF